MPSHTLSLRQLLLGAVLLPSLTSASPARVVYAPASVDNVEPIVVEHGPLDDAGIQQLHESVLGSKHPSRTVKDRDRFDDHNPTTTRGSSLAIKTNGAFISVDVGDVETLDSDKSDCHSATYEGPIKGFHMWMGIANIRAMNVTSINGNTSAITSRLIGSAQDSGDFTLETNERISEFWVLEHSGCFKGFNLTTDQNRTYTALVKEYHGDPAMTKVPVGSGILARMRVDWCDVGLVGHVGWDFLDDLESVTVSDMDYSGFTDNIMPAGPGQTITVGSQIVDNRNSSAEQIITITTQDAVTKSHTLSIADMWQVGGSVSVEKEVGMPMITGTKVKAEFNWMVNRMTTNENTEAETLTKWATVNLRCPPKKYCVGSSFFTSYAMDVKVEATFRAKTKTGHSYFWKQKGDYKGADSLALQLKVDEAEQPMEKRVAVAKQF
ncbi:hypothetical protein C8035_v009180 [Colletotrichum spinosum]|uniref:Natterin-like protein n=1 Tax=Colletotrichum spinosum TaxID=1347390 RepID=A0A4R8QAC8_9PEZI|nr:hypothetical protein C8035_v009180 [Colletotrichum spinosum]